MNCVRCGANLEMNDKFCPNCGAPVQTQKQPEPQNDNQNNIFSYERPEEQEMNYNNVQQTSQQFNYGEQPNMGERSYEQTKTNMNMNTNYGRKTF